MARAEHRILPSEHYPHYLKLDLNVGSDSPHPLALALDETFSGWFALSQKLAHSLLPDAWPQERIERMLDAQGFSTRTLSAARKKRFFLALPELRRSQGTLHPVKWLANLYFDRASVQRGRPYEGSRMEGRLPLQTKEPGDRNTTIFVRLAAKFPEASVDEFVRNTRLFLPENHRIIVADPLSDCRVSTKWAVGQGLRLEKRRM